MCSGILRKGVVFNKDNISVPYFVVAMASIKVAYTSGPIFEKIMKRYSIFSVQIIDYQIDQKQKYRYFVFSPYGIMLIFTCL